MNSESLILSQTSPTFFLKKLLFEGGEENKVGG